MLNFIAPLGLRYTVTRAVGGRNEDEYFASRGFGSIVRRFLQQEGHGHQPDIGRPHDEFLRQQPHQRDGNLGGLRGADATCQSLGAAAAQGAKTWRAYLSVERDPDNGNQPTHARNRTGAGPWHNAAGALVASNVTELHARTGDASVFVDERGQRINGQWPSSPSPNEHDILTGSNADGTVVAGATCSDWTSDAATATGQVGHSDGLGTGGSTAGAATSWNSAHANQNCSNTAPRGGAGRIYCFAR